MQALMYFFLVLQVFCLSATFKSGQYRGYLPHVGVIDQDNSLLVLASSNDISDPKAYVFKNTANSLIFRKPLPIGAGALGNRPSHALVHNQRILALVDERFAPGGSVESQVKFLVLDPTNGNVLSTTLINGPPFLVENIQTSLVTGVKIVASGNRAFVLSTSLQDIARAAYGYTVSCINIETGQVHWIKHYLPVGSEGGSASSIALIGDELWVSGDLGVLTFNIETGDYAPQQFMNAISLTSFDPQMVILSNYSHVQALEPRNKTKIWESSGIGMVQSFRSGQAIWYARTLAEDGNPEMWDVEVGTLASSTGRRNAQRIYNSGRNMGDMLIGFASNERSGFAVIQGTYRSGFLGMSRRKDCRLIELDPFSMNVIREIRNAEMDTPAFYVNRGNIHWTVSYTGDAIIYQ
jgi:hypothetical protein